MAQGKLLGAAAPALSVAGAEPWVYGAGTELLVSRIPPWAGDVVALNTVFVFQLCMQHRLPRPDCMWTVGSTSTSNLG